MEQIGYRNPMYSPDRDDEETEANIEKMMRAVYGDLDPEEMADLKAQRAERMRARLNRGKKAAQKMLRDVGRPVCRRDMLLAMRLAIMDRFNTFEKKPDVKNAAMLLATIICRNILTDGPLHEEE